MNTISILRYSFVQWLVVSFRAQALGEIVVLTLQDKLGPKHMTSEATTAWKRVYGLVVTVIADQMKRERE